MIAAAIWIVVNHFVGRVPEEISEATSVRVMTRYYPYYLMGNAVKRYKLHDMAFGNSYVFGIAALVWACSSYFSFRYSDYVVTTAIILVIMNVCRKIDESGCKVNSRLVYIGQNTLYIYVFHYFALMKTPTFVPFLCEHSNFMMDLAVALVPTAFAVAFSLGVKFILEREPLVMKWVFGKD